MGQAGWSVPKKEWCCRVHGKGCPNQGGGCVTSSEPYDCDAGFANWMVGWSVAKKAWCFEQGQGLPTCCRRMRISQCWRLPVDWWVQSEFRLLAAPALRRHLPVLT